WERYYPLLVDLARKRLRGAPRRVADEEDVALSAFDSFYHGAAQGRFPKLDDRDDLWQLLVLITAPQACDPIQHQGPGKRDWRRVQEEGKGDTASPGALLTGLLSQEPDPAFAAEAAESCRRLLDRLGDDQLRAIAVGKMEGHTNEEIAERLGCSPPTIERR